MPKKGSTGPGKRRSLASVAPPFFTGLMQLIFQLFQKCKIGSIYLRLWRFINFCIVGAIGVGINYLIWILVMSFMPWFLSNALAIAAATLWNYTNDVGTWAWHWGFKEKPKHE